ncbi:hypothetical protein BOTBODRAFT_56353 [Botryobasidium botryosum FD-172 SS1]|uniref:C2H2-type domain-containing protein n=1 Tax=Botryobasidium botryosum (strain FD-172 SS1) TaxID=930990 RepID=A0A067MMD9_BOTB1|nr:hypothetical protein BOTBODRAFT_56353 [Botryobasidium botryosum FD-172 SS1]
MLPSVALQQLPLPFSLGHRRQPSPPDVWMHRQPSPSGHHHIAYTDSPSPTDGSDHDRARSASSPDTAIAHYTATPYDRAHNPPAASYAYDRPDRRQSDPHGVLAYPPASAPPYYPAPLANIGSSSFYGGNSYQASSLSSSPLRLPRASYPTDPPRDVPRTQPSPVPAYETYTPAESNWAPRRPADEPRSGISGGMPMGMVMNPMHDHATSSPIHSTLSAESSTSSPPISTLPAHQPTRQDLSSPPSEIQSPPVTQSKTYSFVSLPGNQVKKRPRRRYDEIERLYSCNFGDCSKAYGTLNHLNAHVSMQRHGPKRSPTEFKELRKIWRRSKKEEPSSPRAPRGRRRTEPALQLSRSNSLPDHSELAHEAEQLHDMRRRATLPDARYPDAPEDALHDQVSAGNGSDSPQYWPSGPTPEPQPQHHHPQHQHHHSHQQPQQHPSPSQSRTAYQAPMITSQPLTHSPPMNRLPPGSTLLTPLHHPASSHAHPNSNPHSHSHPHHHMHRSDSAPTLPLPRLQGHSHDSSSSSRSTQNHHAYDQMYAPRNGSADGGGGGYGN